MGTLRVDNIKNLEGSDGPIVEGPTKFDSTLHIDLPSGTIAQRSSDATDGAIRYNQDLGRLEYYDGDRWVSVDIKSNVDRGIIRHGLSPSYTNTIEYVTISSTGNAVDFGDTFENGQRQNGASNSVRGVFAGGYNSSNPSPTGTLNMQYVTIASTGDAADFGDLVNYGRDKGSGFGNATRGIFCAGFTSPAQTIQYVTFASEGDSVNFGDLTHDSATGSRNAGSCSSTRGILHGGQSPTISVSQSISYITIATTGDSQDFGEMSQAKYHGTACGNAVRSVNGGGVYAYAVSTIEYVNIASFGNAIDFGNLTRESRINSATDNSIRGIWAGGLSNPPAGSNVIDYITIATTGDATDFGDLSVTAWGHAALSDCHGGL